jgi:hypothetical protein
MAICEQCGNDSDKAFASKRDGKTHTFDSFECAVHMLAPRSVAAVAESSAMGVESGAKMFCCAHRVRRSGETGLEDRG